MNKNKYLSNTCWWAAALIVLAGCATVEQPLRGHLLAQPSAVRQCAQDFQALDEAVARAGARDAEARRIAGFPYLRVDRFTAQFRDAATFDERARTQWLTRLQGLDQEARRAEIANLPDAEMRAFGQLSREALTERSARCADTLREHDLASPQSMALLLERAHVPDHYSGAQRLAGLYPLTRIPFFAGVRQWQRETLQHFRDTAAGRAPAQPLTTYALAEAPALAREQVAAMMRRVSGNPLRIPDYSSEGRALLARAFAPVLEIETGGDHDRIGQLRWRGAAAPVVDTSAAVVYYRVAYTRHRDYPTQVLTQLVYTLWFPRRPADHALDVLAGELDGLILRITLSPDGDPLLYDSIHPCGCYHLFFTTPRVQALPAPDDLQEWAFVPAVLPAHGAGTRVAVRVATRTHYIVNLSLAPSAAAAQAYTLVPEHELRSLPVAADERGTGNGQSRRSLYGPDGLVAGTERGERYLFWPMGIASAGAMRQWGHHATAFVGRRHFDDADLIDQRFRIRVDAAP